MSGYAFQARKKPQPLDEAALYQYAVAALARQMRTVAELKRLMSRRVEPGEAGESKVAAVVARLLDQHYLDDPAFASTYARLRQENQSFGKRRVQQELTRKGVQAELVAEYHRERLRAGKRRGAWYGATWPASEW